MAKTQTNTIWIRHDASGLLRTKEAGDCQVQALTTARGIPYADAWDLLYVVLGETRQLSGRGGFALKDWLTEQPARFGVVASLSFPAQRGRPRMTAIAFCQQHPRGRFILHMAHHLAAVVDGKLYDTWNSSHKCVYYAWEVTAAEDQGQNDPRWGKVKGF